MQIFCQKNDAIHFFSFKSGKFHSQLFIKNAVPLHRQTIFNARGGSPLLLMEDKFMPTEANIGVTGVTYKFWKKNHNTAIYINKCGGVITISYKGIHFPKARLNYCPAMKSRPGYPVIDVRGDSKTYHILIHRAVAEVYLHPKNLFEIEVDHLDNNVNNYHVLNLEYVTHEENIRRAVEMRRKRKAEKGE